MVAESPLSDEERELLGFVVDNYVEGIKDAEKATLEDRTLESADVLCSMFAGYGETEAALERIKIKLNLCGGKR